jgi:hypothetical protein
MYSLSLILLTTRLTQKRKDARTLMDVQLLDHLIITADYSYYSFADNAFKTVNAIVSNADACASHLPSPEFPL